MTITGTGITPGARVLVGPSAAATVVRTATTSLTFRAPALVAGVYDVTLYSASGLESSVMPGGLTYVAPGTPSPSPSPSAPTPSAPTPSAPAPGTATPGSGAGAGGAAPASGVGPHGERLVRTGKYTSLRAGFWALDCSASCRGVQI